MKRLIPALAASLALAACNPPAKPPAPQPQAATTPAKPAGPSAPAGVYAPDPDHTSINFKLNHLGLSMFTARFLKFSGHLNFDPDHPTAQSVDFTIQAASLQTNYPDPKTLDFDKQISCEFLEAPKFPTITFKSTQVTQTGPATAEVTGDFTLHGVTKPVVLHVTYNGGYPPSNFDPSGARIGFSANTTLKRSDYGISSGIPAPGSTMGVGDEITVAIESEWTYKPPGWTPGPMPAG